jgi:hypothetical protein
MAAGIDNEAHKRRLDHLKYRFNYAKQEPFPLKDGIYARVENTGLQKDLYNLPSKNLSSLIDPATKTKMKNDTSILRFDQYEQKSKSPVQQKMKIESP